MRWFLVSWVDVCLSRRATEVACGLTANQFPSLHAVKYVG